MVLTKWIGKSRDSRRMSDIGTIQRALSTYQADYENNSDGSLPISNTTWVEYDSWGTVGTAVYYTEFDEDYFDVLNNDGFDTLQKVVTDPDGGYYILGIDDETEGKFSIAATLENGDSASEAAVRWNFGGWQSIVYTWELEVSLPSLVPHKRTNTTNPVTSSGDFVSDWWSDLPY